VIFGVLYILYIQFKSFTFLLAINGITQTYFSSYHQNGVIERKHIHIHITQFGSTIVQNASSHLKFRDSGFQTVVYLINTLPTASLHFYVAYNVLYKQSPNHNILEVHGCACFPFLTPYNNQIRFPLTRMFS